MQNERKVERKQWDKFLTYQGLGEGEIEWDSWRVLYGVYSGNK